MMRRLMIALACVFGGVALLGAAALSGFVPLPGVLSSPARPACRALPTAGEVASALVEHPEVTKGLQSAASGTEVSVSKPCEARYADRALVRVTVRSGDARDQVSDWLKTHDAYGVPLEVKQM